jgi:tetrahydrodipicolinate N-succinyltransferase
MGVYIGQSTKIYDRETGEVTYGRIPPGSVVVSAATCRRTAASTACTRHHRQEGRCADALEDQHQRTAARD